MSFDGLAPFYRAMEFLTAGGKLQRCRTVLLDEIPIPSRVFLAGEGHGRFLLECVARFPEAHITVLDFSEQMLNIARRNITSERVEFVHADLLKWEGPSEKFDLIVTHFFLDCFPSEALSVVVSQLGNHATPTAQWLLADFQIAPGRAARIRSFFILCLLYRFFRLTTGISARSLVPPDTDLRKLGFARHRRVTFDWDLLKSEWWQRMPI